MTQSVRLTEQQRELAAQWLRYANGLAMKFTAYHPWQRDEARSEVLLTLCRAALKFDPGRGVSFPTYLYKCVRRRLRDMASACRAVQAGQVELDVLESAPKVAGDWRARQIEDMKELGRAVAVARLGRIERDVVELHYLAEPAWTLAAIAEKNRVTPQRVSQLKETALRKLREVLD